MDALWLRRGFLHPLPLLYHDPLRCLGIYQARPSDDQLLFGWLLSFKSLHLEGLAGASGAKNELGAFSLEW